MREALRHEHQNNEQQNLVRVAENLELTRELNLLRKKNTALGAEVTRLQAKMKVRPRTGTQQGRTSRLAIGGEIPNDAVALPEVSAAAR